MDELFPSALVKELPKAIYIVGACEAYQQRTKATKSQALKACEHIFESLGCSLPSQQEYVRTYSEHLVAYALILKLLGDHQNRQSLVKWIRQFRIPLSKWTVRFVALYDGSDLGSFSRRLTHLSGNDTADQMAKAAWNVAWDIVLLDRADEIHGHIVTHDRGLADWYSRSSKEPSVPLFSSQHCNVTQLAHSVEDSLGVTCHFDAQQSYSQGLWPIYDPKINDSCPARDSDPRPETGKEKDSNRMLR